MKKIILPVLLSFACGALLTACGGGGGGAVYRHYNGYGPWHGHYNYYRDGGVVVVPDVPNVPEVLPEFEATPLPSGPDMMMDVDMSFDAF